MRNAAEVEWQRLSAWEVSTLARSEKSLALLPIGSVEQHGPHLPTSTDTICAHEIALRAARVLAARHPLIVLPALWTGLSDHHLDFGGTISLTHDEFSSVLGGIVRSIVTAGFERILIVNGHGGNIPTLAVCCNALHRKHGIQIITVTPWDLDGPSISKVLNTADNALHACEAETSLILAIERKLVNLGAFTCSVDEDIRLPPDEPGVVRYTPMSRLSPRTGTLGDPRLATAEKGERLLTIMTAAVVRIVELEELWSL